MFTSRRARNHGGEETVTGVETRQALAGLPVAGDFSGDFLDDELVLFHFERARGVNQAAAGTEMLQRLTEERYLLGVEVEQIARLEAPLDLGIAAEGAGAGARRVDQHAIKVGAEGQRPRAVEDDQRAVEIAHLFQAVRVDV